MLSYHWSSNFREKVALERELIIIIIINFIQVSDT